MAVWLAVHLSHNLQEAKSLAIDRDELRTLYEGDTRNWDKIVIGQVEIEGEHFEGRARVFDAQTCLGYVWEWRRCPQCGEHQWGVFGASYETYGRCLKCGYITCLHSG